MFKNLFGKKKPLISQVIKDIPRDRDLKDTPQIAYILSKAEHFSEEEDLPIKETFKKMTEYYGLDAKHPLECRNSAIDFIMELCSYDRVSSKINENLEEIEYKHSWDENFEPVIIYRKIEDKIDGKITFIKVDLYDNEIIKMSAKFYENKYFNEYYDLTGISGLEGWFIKIADKVVGFCAYQDVEFAYHLCDIILMEQFELTDYHKKIQEFVLAQLPDKTKGSHIYLRTSEEVKFYETMGFIFYKDFETFEPGQNLMRFVMDFPNS